MKIILEEYRGLVHITWLAFLFFAIVGGFELLGKIDQGPSQFDTCISNGGSWTANEKIQTLGDCTLENKG